MPLLPLSVCTVPALDVRGAINCMVEVVSTSINRCAAAAVPGPGQVVADDRWIASVQRRSILPTSCVYTNARQLGWDDGA